MLRTEMRITDDINVLRKKNTNVAYNKRLIKGQHNDELDRQEFNQWAPSFEFFVCEAIEHDQTVESKAEDSVKKTNPNGDG